MFKISRNKLFFQKVMKIVLSVVLTLSLVTTVFYFPASAGEYTDINKSKYHLANWYGLEELPYGENSGVVYLRGWNGSKWLDLTICFNKCTPMVDIVGNAGSLFASTNFNENAIIDNFTYDHLWGLKSGDTSNGNSFYFSCITDSPVYYTYGNTGEQWKTMSWSYVSEAVYVPRYTTSSSGGEVSTVVTPTKQYRTVYVYLDVSLGSLGFNVVTGSGRAWFVYSNYLMVNNLSGNYGKDYIDYYAMTFNTPKDSQYTGNYQYPTTKQDVYYYAYCYYPTSECLRDWQLYDSLNSVSSKLTTTNGYLYLLVDNTNEIIDLLKDISTGGEPYPSEGLLNDNKFSDKVNGVIGDITVDTGSSSYISSLSASFSTILLLWKSIVLKFSLEPVIGLLLFLAFVAYLLGRALKGRSD